MYSKRDLAIFSAGALASHTFSHIFMQFSHTLPIRVFSYTFTAHTNVMAILINALATVGMLYLAHCLKNKNTH